MLQNGIVRKISGEQAEVEIQRSSACGESCAACGLCSGQFTIVTAANEVNAAEGDRVMLEMTQNKVLGAAFLVYIVPVIALIVGYFIGCALSGRELFSVAFGFGLMALSFVFISLFDRKLKKSYIPRIVGVADDE